jgi:hypothetical protein
VAQDPSDFGFVDETRSIVTGIGGFPQPIVVFHGPAGVFRAADVRNYPYEPFICYYYSSKLLRAFLLIEWGAADHRIWAKLREVAMQADMSGKLVLNNDELNDLQQNFRFMLSRIKFPSFQVLSTPRSELIDFEVVL